MDDKHSTASSMGVPTWYTAAIPALMVALALVVLLARATA